MTSMPPESPPPVEPISRLARAKKAVFTGAVMIITGVLFMATPFLLGKGQLNKYFVVIGMLSAIFGASFILHGGFDWLRERFK